MTRKNKKEIEISKDPKSTIKKPKNNVGSFLFLNPYTNGLPSITTPDTGAGLVDNYWTKNRDKQLDQLVKQSDYMFIALANVIYKVFSVPPIIKLEDADRGDSEEDKDLLKFYQTLLNDLWCSNVVQYLYSTLVYDNGFFIEILTNGGGSSSSQLTPSTLADGTEIPALSFKILDTLRCTRTGDDTYPVIYKSTDGKNYKFHHSRIIYGSDMTSPKPEMYGVGFSAVSRVLQNLTQAKASDDLLYSMLYDGDIGRIIQMWEKEGDKQSLVEDLSKLFELSTQKNKDYKKGIGTKTIIMGSDGTEPPQMLEILLQKLPDGFNKREMIEDIMTLIAFSIGVDVREIYHVKGGGATKADATIQDKKSTKKFISWFLTITENWINNHILPSWMKVNFDDIDEDNKRLKAEARKVLAETHKIELENGTITVNNQIIPGISLNTPNNQPQGTNGNNQETGLFRSTKQAEPGEVLLASNGFVLTTGDIAKAKEEALGTKIGELLN
jgi:hypothetical protein